MRRVGLCMGVAALLTAMSVARVEAALYGTIPNGGDTTLVTIDTTTGAATAVGSIGLPDVQGLAARPSDTTLFGGVNNADNPQAGQVLTISPAVGSAGTAIGSPDSGPIGGMALSPSSVLYATCSRFSGTPRKPDCLCTVNQLTGELTPVNQFQPLDPTNSIANFNGLAFSGGGVLYATTSKVGNPAGEPRLYTISTTSGVASPVGAIRDAGNAQLNAGVVGLEFVGAVLYGSTDDGRIITIDPATGIYTVKGSTGLGTVQGLADLFVITPTPTRTTTLTPSITPTITPTVPTPTPTPGPCTPGVPTNPCIPGGGSTKTDCQIEFIATPVPLLQGGTPVPDLKNGIQRNRLYCYDGDTRCDVDGVKDNASCTFQLGLCINNHDARFGSCTPLDLATFEVKGPNPKNLRDSADTANLTTLEGIGDGASGGFGVNVFRGKTLQIAGNSNNLPDHCSSSFNLVVPCKQSARGPSKAKKTIKLKVASSAGAKDTDSIKLECRPSTCGNGVIEADHETCDDGNRTNGDGCNQACQLEVPPTPTPTAPDTPTPPPTNTPGAPTDTPTQTQTPTNTMPGVDTATPTVTPTRTPTTPAASTSTPTSTPSPTPSPTTGALTIPVILAPGGGTAGSCRGTCVGGFTPGASCGATTDCPKACVGGRDDGKLCTSVADCRGPGTPTCPIPSCSNRMCAGGPLNGTACTSSTVCNGCSQSPPQGSCAIVQNPLFPVIVPLNGVCSPRKSPPGDVPCTTSAECKSCVGGSNAGNTCTSDTNCPSGACTGAGTCTLARLSLQVGATDGGTGEAPVTIPQASLVLNPALVSGIGTVCVLAGGTGTGQIDCDGGRTNLNTLLRRDHNTNPGNPGNYGARCKGGTSDGQPCSTEADCPGSGPPGASAYCAGLPNDPTCALTQPQADGSTQRACLEGTRRCVGGINDGQLCAGFSADCAWPSACVSITGTPPFTCNGGPNNGATCTPSTLTCPGGACTPCNTGVGDGPHPGICNSPTYVAQSGTFGAGDIGVGLPLAIAVYSDTACGGVVTNCFGPDGLACTSDDTPPAPPAPVTVALSTGTNQIYVLDASNDGTGKAISPETLCPATPCTASVTGAPAPSCAAVYGGSVNGITLSGGFPAFDTTAGDIATTFLFKLQTGP